MVTPVSRSFYYYTMFNHTNIEYNKKYNNCNNTLCYTYSNNSIYKPHSVKGSIGTTSLGSRASKFRT